MAGNCGKMLVETNDLTTEKSKRPGRPGLSFEAYEKAYQKLTSEDGVPPSQRQLRRYLGTGSNTTLATYRQRIAENSLTDEQPLELGTPDASLFAAVQRFASEIALDEARVVNDRVDEIRTSAEQKIRIAESTMEKRLRDVDVLEHRADRAESDLKEYRGNLKLKEGALTVLVAKYDAMKEEKLELASTLKELTRENEANKKKIADLHQELVDEENSNASKLDEAKLEAVRIKESLDSVREKHSELKEANKNLLQLQTGLNERLNERNRLVDTHVKQLEEANSRVGEMKVTLDVMSNNCNLAKIERERYSAKCKEIASLLESEKQSAENSMKRILTDVKDKTAQIAHLQKTVHALTPLVTRK